MIYIYIYIIYIQGGPKKKRPVLFFIPKLCFTFFSPYFSRGVDSRPGRFFWHQFGSKWTLYYAGVDKNHRGVRCRKISSNTAVMQERFWQEQCAWWKDNSTFGGQISEDRCSVSEFSGRCSPSRDRSSFGIIPENIQNLRECHEDFPGNQHAVLSK